MKIICETCHGELLNDKSFQIHRWIVHEKITRYQVPKVFQIIFLEYLYLNFIMRWFMTILKQISDVGNATVYFKPDRTTQLTDIITTKNAWRLYVKHVTEYSWIRNHFTSISKEHMKNCRISGAKSVPNHSLEYLHLNFIIRRYMILAVNAADCFKAYWTTQITHIVTTKKTWRSYVKHVTENCSMTNPFRSIGE